MEDSLLHWQTINERYASSRLILASDVESNPGPLRDEDPEPNQHMDQHNEGHVLQEQPQPHHPQQQHNLNDHNNPPASGAEYPPTSHSPPPAYQRDDPQNSSDDHSIGHHTGHVFDTRGGLGSNPPHGDSGINVHSGQNSTGHSMVGESADRPPAPSRTDTGESRHFVNSPSDFTSMPRTRTASMDDPAGVDEHGVRQPGMFAYGVHPYGPMPTGPPPSYDQTRRLDHGSRPAGGFHAGFPAGFHPPRPAFRPCSEASIVTELRASFRRLENICIQTSTQFSQMMGTLSDINRRTTQTEETVQNINAQMTTMSDDIRANRDNYEAVADEVSHLRDRCSFLHGRMSSLEQGMHRMEEERVRQNLKFMDFPEGGVDENCVDVVNKLLSTHYPNVNWGDDAVSEAQRLGRRHTSAARPRPILAKFKRWEDVMKVLGSREGRTDMMNKGGVRVTQEKMERQFRQLRSLREQGRRGLILRGVLHERLPDGRIVTCHDDDLHAGFGPESRPDNARYAQPYSEGFGGQSSYDVGGQRNHHYTESADSYANRAARSSDRNRGRYVYNENNNRHMQHQNNSVNGPSMSERYDNQGFRWNENYMRGGNQPNPQLSQSAFPPLQRPPAPPRDQNDDRNGVRMHHSPGPQAQSSNSLNHQTDQQHIPPNNLAQNNHQPQASNSATGSHRPTGSHNDAGLSQTQRGTHGITDNLASSGSTQPQRCDRDTPREEYIEGESEVGPSGTQQQMWPNDWTREVDRSEQAREEREHKRLKEKYLRYQKMKRKGKLPSQRTRSAMSSQDSESSLNRRTPTTSFSGWQSVAEGGEWSPPRPHSRPHPQPYPHTDAMNEYWDRNREPNPKHNQHANQNMVGPQVKTQAPDEASKAVIDNCTNNNLNLPSAITQVEREDSGSEDKESLAHFGDYADDSSSEIESEEEVEEVCEEDQREVERSESDPLGDSDPLTKPKQGEQNREATPQRGMVSDLNAQNTPIDPASTPLPVTPPGGEGIEESTLRKTGLGEDENITPSLSQIGEPGSPVLNACGTNGTKEPIVDDPPAGTEPPVKMDHNTNNHTDKDSSSKLKPKNRCLSEKTDRMPKRTSEPLGQGAGRRASYGVGPTTRFGKKGGSQKSLFEMYGQSQSQSLNTKPSSKQTSRPNTGIKGPCKKK